MHSPTQDPVAGIRLIPLLWLLPLVGLIVTVVLALSAADGVRGEQRRRLAEVADGVVARLEAHLQDHEGMLRAARGHYLASGDVLPAEWIVFTREVQRDRPLHGLRSVGLMERVPAADLHRHQAKMRRLVGAAYHVWPLPPGRAELLPVTRVAPDSEVARQVLGFDQSTEPVRAKAIEHARHSGRIAVTDQIRLVQDGQIGLILFLPVRARAVAGEGADTPAAYVYGAVVVADLVTAAMADDRSRVALRLTQSDGRDLFGEGAVTGGMDEASLEPVRRTVDFGGQQWRAEFRPLAGILRVPGVDTPGTLALVGGVLTVLLGVVAWIARSVAATAAAATAAARAEREAARNLTQGVLDALPVAVMAKDEQHRYVLVNKTMERIAGVTADAVLDRTDDDFYPPDVAARHRVEDEEALRTGEPRTFEEPPYGA